MDERGQLVDNRVSLKNGWNSSWAVDVQFFKFSVGRNFFSKGVQTKILVGQM